MGKLIVSAVLALSLPVIAAAFAPWVMSGRFESDENVLRVANPQCIARCAVDSAECRGKCPSTGADHECVVRCDAITNACKAGCG